MNHLSFPQKFHFPKVSSLRRHLRQLSWRKILAAAAASFGILCLIFILFLWRLTASAPSIDEISVRPQESATYLCDQDGNEVRRLTLAASNRDIVGLDEISVYLQNAVVAIEDRRFYEHQGIDTKGILRAFFSGITRGSFSEGASTITQQLVKNSVFTQWTQENSFYDRVCRKVQEQHLALQLEKRLSKEEILENYLNTVNFGSGCYGAQAAAKRYFAKDVSSLTLSEAAVLAAALQNPSGYDPALHPAASRSRQLTVLNYMQQQGYISATEHQAAENDPVYDRVRQTAPEAGAGSVYSYYEDALIAQVQELLMQEKGYSQEQAARAVFCGGLRIYSAQDDTLQQICEEEFSNPANFPDKTGSNARLQASLVLIDQKTGCVRAIVGGRGKKSASLTLNRATDSLRQPGSTFKILAAYAPALDACGKTLISCYENEPFTYTDGTPVGNWDDTDYGGNVTIREAIVRSINVAAVRCITEISPQAGFSYARRFGITTLHNADGSDGASDVIQPLALGGITEGVSNLELGAAYAAIANGGVYRTPRFFTRIEDRNGALLFDFSDTDGKVRNFSASEFFSETPVQRDNTRILKDSTAFLLTDALSDVVSDPSGTAYTMISAAGQPVAGKTGTTSGYRDIWFAGSTPYYTCSVWGGYDDHSALPASAHSYQKTLWSAVMNRVHTGLTIGAFPQPDSVVSFSICKDSHLRANENGCPDTYLEYFADGTQPDEICPLHNSVLTPEAKRQSEQAVIYPELLERLGVSGNASSAGVYEHTTQKSNTIAESDEHPQGNNILAGSAVQSQDNIPHGVSNEHSQLEASSENPAGEHQQNETGGTTPESGHNGTDRTVSVDGQDQNKMNLENSALQQETNSLDDLLKRLYGKPALP